MGLVLFALVKKPTTTLPNIDLLKTTFLCPLSWRKKGKCGHQIKMLNPEEQTTFLRCSTKKRENDIGWCSYKNKVKLKEIRERNKRNRRLKEEVWINFWSSESLWQIKLWLETGNNTKFSRPSCWSWYYIFT